MRNLKRETQPGRGHGTRDRAVLGAGTEKTGFRPGGLEGDPQTVETTLGLDQVMWRDA